MVVRIRFFLAAALIVTMTFLCSCDGGGNPSSPLEKAVSLNDTGIYWCADFSSNFLDCLVLSPAAGVMDYLGQDVFSGRDARAREGSLVKIGGGNAGFDFTKLGANGQPLAIQNAFWSDVGNELNGTQWSCVRDNHTQLVWEIKTSDPESLHFRNHTYSWRDTNPTSNGSDPGSVNGGNCVGSSCDTKGFVAAVNALGWCGARDWRMPSVRNLETIVDFGNMDPAIDKNYFPDTQSQSYWSSSAYAGYSVGAWGVDFVDGAAIFDNKRTNYFKVRLVRAGN